MTIRTQVLLPTLAAVLALPLSGGMTTAMAQTGKPPTMSMPSHQGDMKGKLGPHDMMSVPHYALAMAYRDNLVTFTRAVQHQAAGAATVDLDLARPAVLEMRRSFDQMQLHHKAQMTMMNGDMAPMAGDAMKHPMSKPMMAMTQDMDTHLAALTEHLTGLEAELNASVPSPKNVSMHTAEILKHCAGMSGARGKIMPASVKPKE